MLGFINDFDKALLDFIQANIKTEFLDVVMPYITMLGNGGIIWIIAGIILVFIKKHRAIGFTVLLALVLCLLIGNLGIKPLITRLRPFDVYPHVTLLIPRPHDFSFPSGHTMSSFAAATVLFWNYKRIGICALIIAILIAFSRLYLYVHYPTDVLGGIIIGVGIAAAAAFIVKTIEERRGLS